MPNQEETFRKQAPINKNDLYKSLIPSLIVLAISIFFGEFIKILTNFFTFSQENPNFSSALTVAAKLWFYPVIIYIIFFLCLTLVRKKLDESLSPGTSRKELSKMIDKWSGIVDGIGTALPLIGAAVILLTVGLGRDYEYLFIEFAVPFEIKSLFILAIAKLFEFAFNELELQYQRMLPEDVEEEGSKMPGVNLPDRETMEEFRHVLREWNTTVENMRDPVLEKNLDNIVKIIGRK